MTNYDIMQELLNLIDDVPCQLGIPCAFYCPTNELFCTNCDCAKGVLETMKKQEFIENYKKILDK